MREMLWAPMMGGSLLAPAGLVAKVVGFADALPDDAALARQLRRKFLKNQ